MLYYKVSKGIPRGVYMRPFPKLLAVVLLVPGISLQVTNSYAAVSPKQIPFTPTFQLVNDGDTIWRTMRADIQADRTMTDQDKTKTLQAMEDMREAIRVGIDAECGAKVCSLSRFVQAATDGFGNFLDSPKWGVPTRLALDTNGSPTEVTRAKVWLKSGMAFALYGGLVWGTGLVIGTIPDSAGSAKTIASIIAGGIIGNAGAFFLDKVNSATRGLFFRIASAQKAATGSTLGSFARFISVWQAAQDAMGDGRLTDGRNRETMAKHSTISTLNAALAQTQGYRERVELVALAMEQFRLAHPEVPVDTSDRADGKNVGSIDKLFAAQLRSMFGNKKAFFDILTEVHFADDELRKKDLPAQKRAEIFGYYEKVAVLWLKPEAWSDPESGKMLLDEFKKQSKTLISARDAEEKRRAKILEDKMQAKADGRCDHLSGDLGLTSN